MTLFEQGLAAGAADAAACRPTRAGRLKHGQYRRGYEEGYARSSRLRFKAVFLRRHEQPWSTWPAMTDLLTFHVETRELGLALGSPPTQEMPGEFTVCRRDHWSVKTWPPGRIVCQRRLAVGALVRNFVKGKWLALPAATRSLIQVWCGRGYARRDVTPFLADYLEADLGQSALAAHVRRDDGYILGFPVYLEDVPDLDAYSIMGLTPSSSVRHWWRYVFPPDGLTSPYLRSVCGLHAADDQVSTPPVGVACLDCGVYKEFSRG